MKNIFKDIGLRKPRKSSFDLGHSRKFSFRPGVLTPIFCHDAMPGDKFTMSTSALVRMMPMLAPVMHLVDICSYSFAVPMRLCMEQGKFEVFITGGKDGDGKDAQGETIQVPYFRVKNLVGGPDPTCIDIGRLAYGGLADFLGINLSKDDFTTMGTEIVNINLMPFVAFWRIWCEYFRDQNLHPDYVSLYPAIFNSWGDCTTQILDAETDPDNPFDFFSLPYVCWEKDMYTSALPFAQRGNPVETPLSGTATVTYKTPSLVTPGLAGTNTQALGVRDGTANINRSSDGTFDDPTGDTTVDNIDDVTLTSGGFTINALRLAARLQEWLERMARGGARYVEQTLSMWGVISSDARLQRPEYLAGGKMPVHISEVLQTGEAGTTPLGEMGGHGVAAGNVTHWSKFFEEHCYIITVMFMRPKTAYQQGIPRLFTQRFDKLDWPWPQFAHLGEQEVLNKEVWFNGDAADLETFGYQQRYIEYKYIPNTVHGEFKNTLDFWHWGRVFPTRPVLNESFVRCSPDSRIFNVLTAGDELYCIVNNKITAIRPLPYYGEPQL